MAMCQEDSEEHQNSKNDWTESQSLHRQFLSQPPGQRGLFLSLPHSTTQLAYRLLCPLYLLPLVMDCLDPAGRMSSACTGLTEDGEEHSRNCSWVLETILIKSLHSSGNATCWNTYSFEDQWLLKTHSEQRSAYALPLSSLPVLLIQCVSASYKRRREHEFMW